MKSAETYIQIRFCDIDQLGHVNNAVYLSYLEIARIPYFENIIGYIDWLNEGFIIAKAEIDFKIPILLNDNIKIKLWCSRLGTKSFDLSYSIIKVEQEHEIEMASAKTVMVCYNYTQQTTIEVPKSWIPKLV